MMESVVLTVVMDRLQVKFLILRSSLVRHTRTPWTMMMWTPCVLSLTISPVLL